MKINTYQKKKAKNVRPNTWDKRKINTFEIEMRLNNKIASPEICHFPFFLPENSGYQFVKKTMENTIIKIIIQQIKR